MTSRLAATVTVALLLSAGCLTGPVASPDDARSTSAVSTTVTTTPAETRTVTTTNGTGMAAGNEPSTTGDDENTPATGSRTTTPDPNETVSRAFEEATLGARLSVTGPPSLVEEAVVAPPANRFASIDRPGVVTPTVRLWLPDGLSEARLELSYDPGNVSDGEESALVVLRYDPTDATYDVLASDVHPRRDAVSAAVSEAGVYFVAHEPTWQEQFRATVAVQNTTTPLYLSDTLTLVRGTEPPAGASLPADARASEFTEFAFGGDGVPEPLLLPYDETAVPGGDEDGLVVLRYDADAGEFVRADARFDPDGDAAYVQRPADGVYVIVHEETWRAATDG